MMHGNQGVVVHGTANIPTVVTPSAIIYICFFSQQGRGRCSQGVRPPLALVLVCTTHWPPGRLALALAALALAALALAALALATLTLAAWPWPRPRHALTAGMSVGPAATAATVTEPVAASSCTARQPPVPP